MTLEQRLQDLQREKMEAEISLVKLQEQRVRQERDIAGQTWRAVADAMGAFGPTLVGIGLLFQVRRALNHWIPPDPARAKPPVEEGMDEDDEDL